MILRILLLKTIIFGAIMFLLATLRDCVTVARMTLTHFVWVRILVPQPIQKGSNVKLGPFCLTYYAHSLKGIFSVDVCFWV